MSILDTSQSSSSSPPPPPPSPSPSPPTILPDHPRTLSLTTFSMLLTLSGHGTPLVIRNCLPGGRCFFLLAGSPDSHVHVGHLYTSSSPAATYSSGVSTPRDRKADDFRVGVAHSRADFKLDKRDGIIYFIFCIFILLLFLFLLFALCLGSVLLLLWTDSGSGLRPPQQVCKTTLCLSAEILIR